MHHLLEKAKKNLGDTLKEALIHSETDSTLIVYDKQTQLSCLLFEAYQGVLPNAECIHFEQTPPTEIIEKMTSMPSGSLVVLIQSTNFRLNEFRVRIELFQRGLKTIEHVHLARMSENQYETYVDSLAYDAEYYHTYGHALKKKLDGAKQAVVECAGTTLVYNSAMEEAKLNIGDYRAMKNVGGTFPIGEVFTEPKDLTAINGQAKIFAFADLDHMMKIYEPFLVDISEGILTAPDAPPAFQKTLETIRQDEEVLVREFGLGLNRAMGKNALVNDITAFERMRGLHLSLGAKHGVYQKPGLKHKKTRFHIDVFVDIERILLDNEVIFANGQYIL